MCVSVYANVCVWECVCECVCRPVCMCACECVLCVYFPQLDVVTEQSDEMLRSKRAQDGLIVSAVQNLYTRCVTQMGGAKVVSGVSPRARTHSHTHTHRT